MTRVTSFPFASLPANTSPTEYVSTRVVRNRSVGFWMDQSAALKSIRSTTLQSSRLENTGMSGFPLTHCPLHIPGGFRFGPRRRHTPRCDRIRRIEPCHLMSSHRALGNRHWPAACHVRTLELTLGPRGVRGSSDDELSDGANSGHELSGSSRLSRRKARFALRAEASRARREEIFVGVFRRRKRTSVNVGVGTMRSISSHYLYSERDLACNARFLAPEISVGQIVPERRHLPLRNRKARGPGGELAGFDVKSSSVGPGLPHVARRPT